MTQDEGIDMDQYEVMGKSLKYIMKLTNPYNNTYFKYNTVFHIYAIGCIKRELRVFRFFLS